MATCDFRMRAHQNFKDEVLSTTNPFKEWDQSFELEFAMMKKQLQSLGEHIESHKLKVILNCDRLKEEIIQEMDRSICKSRLRFDLILQNNQKYANEVEILDVQGKINDAGIERNKSITNDSHQDFGFGYDIYNTGDIFVDELCSSSVFIYANGNTSENCGEGAIKNEIIHHNGNSMIQHNRNSIASTTFKSHHQNKKHSENCFDNTYYNNVFYDEFLEKLHENDNNNNNTCNKNENEFGDCVCNSVIIKEVTRNKLNGSNNNNSNTTHHKLRSVSSVRLEFENDKHLIDKIDNNKNKFDDSVGTLSFSYNNNTQYESYNNIQLNSQSAGKNIIRNKNKNGYCCNVDFNSSRCNSNDSKFRSQIKQNINKKLFRSNMKNNIGNKRKRCKYKCDTHLNQFYINSYLPSINEEKDIEYGSSKHVNVSEMSEHSNVDTDNNKVNTCGNQFEYQRQNSNKINNILRFDNFDNIVQVPTCNINDNSNNSSNCNILHDTEKSKRNNDYKSAFNSTHAFVAFFLLFANCFGISNGDNGVLFEYETNGIVDKNNYDNYNVNNVNLMCCDFQWTLQQYHFENAADYQGSKLCWESTDSVCTTQAMRDSIRVNQTENNSVSNFDEIVQGEHTLKNSQNKIQLQQPDIFATWIKMHLYFLFSNVDTHAIIEKTKQLRLYRCGIFTINIDVFNCSLINDVNFDKTMNTNNIKRDMALISIIINNMEIIVFMFNIVSMNVKSNINGNNDSMLGIKMRTSGLSAFTVVLQSQINHDIWVDSSNTSGFCTTIFIIVSESDKICNVPENVGPHGNADIALFVLNKCVCSLDTSFECLLLKGTDNDDFIYLPFQDGEILLDIEDLIYSCSTLSPTSNPIHVPFPNAMSKFILSLAFNYCDLRNGTQYLAWLVSIGCSMSDNECTSMQVYVFDVIENIYNSDTMNSILFTDYLDGSVDASVSKMVNLLDCGVSNSIVICIMNEINTYKIIKKWTVSMINLCLSDDFSCVVNGGTSGDNHNDFDKAPSCESRILSPTAQPSVNIIVISTLNSEFSTSLTHKSTNSAINEACECNCFQVYIISMLGGYVLNSNECKSMKEFLKIVTKQTFDPGQVLFGLIPHNYDVVGFVANTIDKFIVVVYGYRIACNDGVHYDMPFSICKILVLFILLAFYVLVYEKRLIDASNNIVLILIVINTFLIFASKMITNGIFENNNKKGADSNNGGAMATWDKIIQCTNFQFDFFGVQINGAAIDFNSQVDILKNSFISGRELRLQDFTFNNVTAANGDELIYVYNNIKIHIYNTDLNNSEVVTSDVGSIWIYQSSLGLDLYSVTVTTSTADLKDSETLIIRNFECGSCSLGNNGGEMYLEIKNSKFTNYISNLNGGIISGYNFDSIFDENAPKMTIDTITITKFFGGHIAFIIVNISLLTEQLSAHTPYVSDTWLIRQRTSLFDFGSNIFRSYRVYVNSFGFSHIHNGVFALDNVINKDSIILNNNNYIHVNDIVLAVIHIAEYNYNLTVFINNNYISDNDNYFNFDLLSDQIYSLSDLGVLLYIDMQSLALIPLEYDRLNINQLTVQLNIFFDDDVMIETILYTDATIDNYNKYLNLHTSPLIALDYRNSSIEYYTLAASTLSAVKSGSNATSYLHNSAHVNDLESSDASVHSQYSSTMFGHVNFSDNYGAIFLTSIMGNVPVDFETYNWQESIINDPYADGSLVFSNVSILSNNLDDGHLFFMYLSKNRILVGLMIGITLYQFHDKCMCLQDLSIMVTNAVFSDNKGSFIMNMDRNAKSIDTEKIESQNLFIANLVARNDIGNVFLSFSNLTFNDFVIIIKCDFGSLEVQYIAYITSAIDAAENSVGDLAFRNLINNIANNCSKCVLMRTSDNDESSGFVDDNNGVVLNLYVTNSEFNVLVINGSFGSLTRASHTVNVIRFEDNNMFINYDISYANDYLFNFDTADTTLRAYFVDNFWQNIDVIQTILKNGPLSMYHYNMNLIADVNYIDATNLLHICLDNMAYYDLENGLLINCIESARENDLPNSIIQLIQYCFILVLVIKQSILQLIGKDSIEYELSVLFMLLIIIIVIIHDGIAENIINAKNFMLKVLISLYIFIACSVNNMWNMIKLSDKLMHVIYYYYFVILKYFYLLLMALFLHIISICYLIMQDQVYGYIDIILNLYYKNFYVTHREILVCSLNGLISTIIYNIEIIVLMLNTLITNVAIVIRLGTFALNRAIISTVTKLFILSPFAASNSSVENITNNFYMYCQNDGCAELWVIYPKNNFYCYTIDIALNLSTTGKDNYKYITATNVSNLQYCTIVSLVPIASPTGAPIESQFQKELGIIVVWLQSGTVLIAIGTAGAALLLVLVLIKKHKKTMNKEDNTNGNGDGDINEIGLFAMSDDGSDNRSVLSYARGLGKLSNRVVIFYMAFEMYDVFADVASLIELLSSEYLISFSIFFFLSSMGTTLIINIGLLVFFVKNAFQNSKFQLGFFDHSGVIILLMFLCLLTDARVTVSLFTSQIFGNLVF